MPTAHQATSTSERELVLTRIINAPSPLALLGAILTARFCLRATASGLRRVVNNQAKEAK